jgi:predicted nucleic acid-binding protein
MKYLLDTNICIYWLKGNEHIEQKILSVAWTMRG